jgi:hypothetical protein
MIEPISPENMDPLTVLSELNVAKEAYIKARQNSKDAHFAMEMARERLSNMQRQFEALVNYLRSHAPATTYWNAGPEDD